MHEHALDVNAKEKPRVTVLHTDTCWNPSLGSLSEF